MDFNFFTFDLNDSNAPAIKIGAHAKDLPPRKSHGYDAALQNQKKEDFSSFLKSQEDRAQTQEKSTKDIANDRNNNTHEKNNTAEANKSLFQTQHADRVIVHPALIQNDKTLVDLDIQDDIQSLILGYANTSESDSATEQKIENLLTQITQGSEGDLEKFRNILTTLAEELTATDDAESTQTDSIAQNLINALSDTELTEIREELQSYLNKEENAFPDELTALVSQWIHTNTHNNTNTDQQKSQRATQHDTHIRTITLIETAPESIVAEKPHHTNERYDARYDATKFNIPRDEGIKSADFKTVLNDATNNAQATIKAGITPLQDNSAGQRFLQHTAPTSVAPLHANGNIFDTAGLNALIPQTTIQKQSATMSAQAMTHNATAQTHPATQMVSATIQKALKAGDDTTIKLRLDPPELGRVEVKMSIDQDNVTKVVLTIEKPETQLLLQKDSDILQKALSDAGLNTDDGLSFELADDTHDFNKGHEQNHNNKKHTHDHNDSHDGETIQTTMDMQVDPRTGRMHYNILA